MRPCWADFSKALADSWPERDHLRARLRHERNYLRLERAGLRLGRADMRLGRPEKA